MHRVIAAVLIVCSGSTIPAYAKNAKIATDTAVHSTGAVDVIIQFKHKPTASHVAKIGEHGGVLKSDLSLVNAMHARVPANRLQELANDPEVRFISPDRALSNMSSSVAFNVAIPSVNAPYAWGLGLSGAGIGVAVIDSGTQDAADLQNSAGKN